MNHESLHHLHDHHGDFDAFCQLMTESAKGRFGPLWWGVWDQYALPALPEAGTVLDLGCGPGGLFAPLRQRHPRVAIVGVEVQPSMLRAARNLGAQLGCRIVEADLVAPLPLDDASVDVAVAAMVLHEMPNPLLLLREVARLLKPGGVWLIYDWVRQPLRRYVGDEPLDAGRLQRFREHCLYAPDDLAFLCEHVGLEVLEVIGRRGGDYAMLAVAKNPPPDSVANADFGRNP